MRASSALRCSTLLFLLAAPAVADDAFDPSKPVHVGPGVTPPKLKYKIEPQYSDEGLGAGVQGTVVVELEVNPSGVPVNLAVISPLGFGLDEKALQALEKWRFEPGLKDGKPVTIAAYVEVNFHLQGRSFDSSAEARRTNFNLALRDLKDRSATRREKAVESIQKLAKQNFPPALYVLGKFLETGQSLPADPERGRLLIQKSADGNYGPALFEVGLSYYEGKRVPQDTEKGLRLMQDAAILGSYQAQLYLGELYQEGRGVPADPQRARRSFSLCAAAAHADCQLRLAKLLLALPQRQDRDYVQAIAWLQLAADQGDAETGQLVATETAQLTPDQRSRANRLKSQLVHKQ